MFGRNGQQNGHRQEEAKALRKKLESVKRSVHNGDDVWRNILRKRYLEDRLRQVSEGD